MAPELATGRRPNLVIAGVSRAGTTSMFHYLGQHPVVVNRRAERLYHDHRQVKRVLRRGYYSINRVRTGAGHAACDTGEHERCLSTAQPTVGGSVCRDGSQPVPSWSRSGGA